MPLGGGITLGTVALISSIIGAGATTTAAIKSTKNNKLRREFESGLAVLNQSQKDRLEKQMLEAKTTEERRKLLEDTLTKTTQVRIQAIEEQKAEAKKQLNKVYTIGLISASILIVGLIFIYVKKKK
jgi:small-conductance mechanosensitive channel